MPTDPLQPPPATPPPDAQPLAPTCSLNDATAGRLFALGHHSPDQNWQPPAPADLQLSLPNYTVLELVGRGGMGAVYRALQHSLERVVALKILPRETAADPAFVARFQQEAKAMASLSHPAILPVFDAGETADGLLYFVMEFADGTDLQQLIAARGRLPFAEALPIITAIGEALQFAHDHGIIHRDIKPSNVMLDRHGQVKVADFGLAKVIAGDRGSPAGSLTVTGAPLGSPHYVAPEQWEHPEQVDHRADLFSLGVLAYEMLTGTRPTGLFPPLSKVVSVDPRLAAIIGKALEHDLNRRYQSAAALLADLARVRTKTRPAAVRALLWTCLALPAIAALFFGIAVLLPPAAPTATPAAPATDPPPAAPQEIDLLARVELPRDVVAGKWDRLRGELTVTSGSFSTTNGRGVPRLELPYLPPDEYDFEIAFTPQSDTEVAQVFAAAGASGSWRPSASGNTPRFSAITRIDGVDHVCNPPGTVRKGATMLPHKPNTSRIEVRRDLLRGYLNGQLLVEWHGDPRRLTPDEHHRLRDPRRLGIVAFNTAATIHRITVNEISGPGKLAPITHELAATNPLDPPAPPPEPALPPDAFVPLLNGRDLTGWDGHPNNWTVADGLLRGEYHRGAADPSATTLTWTGNPAIRFDRCLVKVRWRTLANPGGTAIQLRADPAAHLIRLRSVGDTGRKYSDIATVGPISHKVPRAQLYAGERLTLTADGPPAFDYTFPLRGPLPPPTDWVTTSFLLDGPRTRIFVDDRPVAELVDPRPAEPVLVVVLECRNPGTTGIQIAEILHQPLPPP